MTADRRPVRTLVNTHHHGDHTHGNYLFDGATIVAHEQCRAEILAEGRPGTSELVKGGTWTDVEWGEIQTAPPFLTYTDRVSLYVDEPSRWTAFACAGSVVARASSSTLTRNILSHAHGWDVWPRRVARTPRDLRCCNRYSVEYAC